jgi:hypothetical protein
MKLVAFLVFGMCALAVAPASAGEPGMMHCFAFTTIESATPAEWEAFKKATDAMPARISVVKKVWHGKLRAPLTQYRADAETRKKITKDATSVTGTFDILRRQYGVCMLMENEDSLKAYTANPYHKEWMAAYEKVRVAGTTTYDILAE